MCGILVYICKDPKVKPNDELLHKSLQTIKHRGPDVTVAKWISDQCFMGFHRLSLVGLDPESNQPLMTHGGRFSLVCNGMIYNYADLFRELGVEPETENDCEVITHAVLEWGTTLALERMRGVFSFVLHDREDNTYIIANDPLGIRPLYQGKTRTGDWVFASEPVALSELCDASIEWFKPGTFTFMELSAKYTKISNFKWWDAFRFTSVGDVTGPEFHADKIGQLLTRAVHRRMLGDRPLACLLSGGLDSSTVAALVAREMTKRGQELHTFTIGMSDAPDVLAARVVARHIGSVHHEVIVTAEEMLAAIPEVVRAIQSYDVTTIRASTPQYLLCKFIAKSTDFKIIFNGDCSEEIFASYAYSAFAPSDKAFWEDNARLVNEVHMYDGLRSDRCIAHFGMDARTPFADRDLVEYVLRMPVQAKRFGPRYSGRIEKKALRWFSETILPKEIAWRVKTAFSDGVSLEGATSWHKTCQRHFEALENEDVRRTTLASIHATPYTTIQSAEARMYYRWYVETIGRCGRDVDALVPQYWMPRFVTATDPSARALPTVYSENT